MQLTKSLIANVYGQGCTVLIQLLSIPIFLANLGIEDYGHWLVLSAIPIYISLSDFGLVSVSCNKSLMCYFSLDTKLADRWWNFSKDVSLFFTYISLSFAGVALIFSAENFSTVLVLTASAFLGMYLTTKEYLFRMQDKYHIGVVYCNTARLAEFSSMCSALYFTDSFVLIAISGFVGKGLILFVWRQSLPHGITWRRLSSPVSDIKKIWKDSFAMMMYPVSNMATIQGMTLVISHTLGPVAVVVYSAIRTYARVLTQISVVFNNSLSPLFAKYFSKKEFDEIRNLQSKYNKLTTIILLLCFLVMILFYSRAFEIWTGGKLNPEISLVLLSLSISLFNSLWLPQKIFLQSTNNHVAFGYLYFSISYLTVFLSAFLLVGGGDQNTGLKNILILSLASEILLMVLAIVRQRKILRV